MSVRQQQHHQQLVVLITGCTAGGIGYELCKAFAARKCRVFAASRRIAAMEDLRTDPRIHLLELDVTDHAAVKAAVAEVIAAAGRIDILVNNAGEHTYQGARVQFKQWIESCNCSSDASSTKAHGP